MVCPVCGTECGEAVVCPGCGWDLSLYQGESISQFPAGRLQGMDGWLEVGHFSAKIHKIIHERTVEREVPFRDIIDVGFREATEEACGFLWIRVEDVPHVQIGSELDAVCSEMALVFSREMQKSFYDAYVFLERTSRFLGTPNEASRGGVEKVCCPRCGATKYTVEKRPFRRAYSGSGSLWFALAFLALCLYESFSGLMTQFVCLECGHRWHIPGRRK